MVWPFPPVVTLYECQSSMVPEPPALCRLFLNDPAWDRQRETVPRLPPPHLTHGDV